MSGSSSRVFVDDVPKCASRSLLQNLRRIRNNVLHVLQRLIHDIISMYTSAAHKYQLHVRRPQRLKYLNYRLFKSTKYPVKSNLNF